MRSSAAGAWSGRRIVAQDRGQTCAEVWPANARVPDSISYRTAPKLKMSDRASSGLPSACSGDMYAAVPTTVPSTRPSDVGIGIQQLGQAEVEQLRRSLRRDHHIGGFQIAMQDAARVRFFERRGDLNRQTDRVVRGQRALERLALDVLEHQVVRPDVVDLADVRMIERGDRARFLLEPLAVLPSAA